MPSPAARRRAVAFHATMIPLVLLYVSPMVFVGLLAVRSFSDIVAHGMTAWPRSLSLEGFVTALDAGIVAALGNSLLVTVCTVVTTLALSAMAAFALARYEIPFRTTILLVMLAGNLLPPQILLIPVAKITEAMRIYDTLGALVIVQVGFGMGFYTFVLHGFMRAIPREVFEAAEIDGAGAGRVFWRIVLPLCRPALAALAALAFTWVFNDLIWAMTVLRTQASFPVTAALINLQGGFVNRWNVVAAGSILGAVPPALMFFLFQRHFVSGLMVGTVK